MSTSISITVTTPKDIDAMEVFETMVQDFYDMNKGTYTQDELEQIRFDVTELEENGGK